MFICDNCKQPSRPREPMTKIVTQTRRREYKNKSTGIIEGIGTEIVKEIKVCIDCKH